MEHNETKNEIMTAEEMETNIQRFMQIRNDFYDAIKEIKPNVTSLKETNKSLVAHFEVLRKISEDAEKNIQKTIQSSSKDMAQAAGKELAPTRSSYGRIPTKYDQGLRSVRSQCKRRS